MTFHKDLTGEDLHIARSNYGSGTPVGSITPSIIGEFFFNTDDETLWVSTGLTNTDWIFKGKAPVGTCTAVSVGNNANCADFTDVVAAFNYCNTNATSGTPYVLFVGAGTFSITDTMAHTNPYFYGIQGSLLTILEADTGLTNKPMFTTTEEFYIDGMDLYGDTLANYGDLSTEILISISGTAYHQIDDMYVFGGYAGIKADGAFNLVIDYSTFEGASSCSMIMDNGIEGYFSNSQASNAPSCLLRINNTIGTTPPTEITILDFELKQTPGSALDGTGNGIELNDDAILLAQPGSQVFGLDTGLVVNNTSIARLRSMVFETGTFTTNCIDVKDTSTVTMIGGALDSSKLSVVATASYYMNALNSENNVTAVGSHNEATTSLFEIDRGYATGFNPLLRSQPSYSGYDGFGYENFQSKVGSLGVSFGVSNRDSTNTDNVNIVGSQFSASTSNFNNIRSNLLLSLFYSDYDPETPDTTKTRAWRLGILPDNDSTNPLGFIREYFNGTSYITADYLTPDGYYNSTGIRVDTVDATDKRNYIIDSQFRSWYEATSQTSSGYGGATMWRADHNLQAKTISRQAFTLGQSDVPGAPKYYLRHSLTTSAGANKYSKVSQRIENVELLANKDITLIYYAKADAAKNMAIELVQNFGTGGTPSAEVTAIGAQLVPLTTSWQQIVIPISVPTVSGKTLGTDGNDYLEVNLWFDAGATYDPRTGSLGNQSGVFDISNFYLIEGNYPSVSHLPRIRSEEEEFSKINRYAAMSYNYNTTIGTATTTAAVLDYHAASGTDDSSIKVDFRERMRITPTTSIYDGVGNLARITNSGTDNNTGYSVVVDESKLVLLNENNGSTSTLFHFFADARL